MKLGLIGCGYWGSKCIRALNAIRSCNLIWIADTDPIKLETYKNQGYRVTRNYRDILQDETITGVLVLTPASSHYSIVKDCLGADKHVYVEKPLTTSSAEAEELVLLAESKKLKLMTGHIYLFHPAIKYIKEALDHQKLRSPLHFHFQRRNFGPIRDDVDVLWDLGPHEISILTYMTGSQPVNISAMGFDILGHDRWDMVHANFSFDDRISASMVFSWVNPVKIRELTIISPRKMLIFDDLVADKIRLFPVPQEYEELKSIQPELIATVVPIPDQEPLREELGHFVACLKTDTAPLISGRNGLAVVKVLENIEKVMKNQGGKQHGY